MLEPLEGKARLAVLESHRRMNLFEGSVRSGKTVSSLVAWLKYVRTGPAGNLAMTGRTERTLKRNIIDVLIEWLGPKRCKYTQGTGEIQLLGRRIYVAGADNEAAVTKIQGLTLAGAYVDEVTTIPESFWSMLLTRLSVDGAQVFGTMNPSSPTHWAMKDYLRKAAVHIRHDGTIVRADEPDTLDLARFSFNLRDNPHLSAAYIDALGREFTGLWRLRFVEGLWVVAEGAVYDSIDENLHRTPIEPDPADVERYVVAVDYGTTNPFVALLLAVTAERVFVLREWRWDSKTKGRQLTDAEYSAELTRWLADVRTTNPEVQVTKVIVDPSAASFIAQLWRDSWPGVTGANNTVADGIRVTSSLLASNRLLIHPSCQGLWDEMLGYVWDPKAAGKGNEQPLKIADHGCFIAGTSVETDRGPVPIERIRRGDRVLTRGGLRPVVDAGLTSSSAQVWTVHLSDGGTLTGTGNHPVWIDGRGWVRLDALRYGDTLRTCVQRSSSSEASSSAATPSPSGAATASTSRPAPATARRASVASTSRSGWRRTVRSRPAATSITSTTTRSTTTSTTSPASTARSTWATTFARRSQPARSSLRRPRLSPLLRSGIAARKVERGTASTASGHGKAASLSPASAITAATRSSRSVLSGSARTPASPPGAEHPAWTTSTGPVSAAATPTRRTGTTSAGSAAVRVLAVTPSGRAPVWNLTVAGRPEYFANGVLVHNCDALRYGVMGLRSWWRTWITAPVERELERAA